MKKYFSSVLLYNGHLIEYNIYPCTLCAYAIYMNVMNVVPVTVAERSRACTVFACSEAGTMGSNPTQGMDV
jgi:hypothetical protein